MTTALSLAATPLWELAAEYAEAVEALIEAGGDMSETELVERLDAVQMAFPRKVANCEIVFRALETSAQADKAFAAPWLDRAARKANAAERIKGYVKKCMETAGQSRVESERGGARLQKNSAPSVSYAGEVEALPESCVVRTVAFSASKTLAAVKAGAPIPEGVSIETGSHLRWL